MVSLNMKSYEKSSRASEVCENCYFFTPLDQLTDCVSVDSWTKEEVASLQADGISGFCTKYGIKEIGVHESIRKAPDHNNCFKLAERYKKLV